MPPQFKNPNEAIQFGFSQGQISLPDLVPAETKDALFKVKTYDDLVSTLKTDGKLDDDTAHHVANSSLFSILEKVGINPSEWLLTIPVPDRNNLKFGIEEYNTARRFLGSWSAIQQGFFIIASVAALATIVLGIGPAISLAAGATRLMLAGKAISEVLAFVNVAKFLALPRLLIPGILTAIGTLGSYIAGTQVTATGDLTTYVRTSLAQSQEKLEAAEAKKLKEAAGFAKPADQQDKIIIRMATTKKPVMFTGTLYSFPLAKPDQYDRKIDSRIDSFADLKSDLALQLNEWILGLGGRIKVSIATSYAPFDEQGTKQSGVWLVAQLFYSRIGGAGALLDTILLGPVDPVIYNPTSQEMQTIETQINTDIKVEKIKQIDLPESMLKVITKTGELVTIPVGQVASATPGVAAETAVSATQALPSGESTQPVLPTPTPGLQEGDYVPGKGILQVDGSFKPTALETPSPTPAVPFGFTAPTIPTPPATPPATPTLKAGGKAKVQTPGSTLNLRGGAGTSFPILASIPHDTILTLDNFRGSADGFTWWSTRFNNRDGLVAGEFLIPV